MLCLLCPFTLAYALPIETKLDTATQTVAVLDSSEMQAAPSTQISEIPPEHAEAEDGQLLWPMMPNDTLAQLAKTFYPDSPILEQRFIQKAIRLTKALGVTLLPDTPFKRVQVIAIPDEKEVRAVTHRIKRLQEITHAQNQLQLSYQLKLSGQLKSIIPPPPKPNKAAAQQQKQVVAAKPVLSHTPAIPPAPSARIWQQIQSAVSSWIDTSNTYWSALTDKVKLPAVIDAGLTQSLSQPQWRNVLYLALLLFMVLGLWQLQKRYVRRQITLLNTISTTLENTESGETERKEITPDMVGKDTYSLQEDRVAAA